MKYSAILSRQLGPSLQGAIRRTFFGWFCILSLVSPLLGQQPAFESEPKTGIIRGKVVYDADPKHPWRLGRYYLGNSKSGDLAEAVVAVSTRGLIAPRATSRPATVTMDQKNFQFVPETLAIRAGDKVRFLNSDNHTHNVKTAHPKHSFNVTMPVDGEFEETFAAASGIRQPFEIDCVFHSSMRAWIFVFDHPWFSTTGKDGKFQMENVPPGQHRLEVVHPAGDLRGRETINVQAGKPTDVTIRLSHRRN